MAEVAQNATVYRGSDTDLVFTVEDDSDLTGEELYYGVARHPADPPLLLVAQPPITHEGNVATVPISYTNSLELSAGVYYHELYSVEDDVRLVLATGRLVVLDALVARYTAPA